MQHGEGRGADRRSKRKRRTQGEHAGVWGVRAHLQSKEARLPAAEWMREGQGPDCGAHRHYSMLGTQALLHAGHTTRHT